MEDRSKSNIPVAPGRGKLLKNLNQLGSPGVGGVLIPVLIGIALALALGPV